MSGLSRLECERVIGAIFTRFPYVEMKEESKGSFLDFFTQEGSLSLGLNKRK